MEAEASTSSNTLAATGGSTSSSSTAVKANQPTRQKGSMQNAAHLTFSSAPAPAAHVPASLQLPVDQACARLETIPAHLPIILRLPSTKHKALNLVPGKTVSLGKFGAFQADDLIGMPFGHTYEIVGGNGLKNKPGELRMVANRTLAELEETDATNENINDDGESQKLTYVDIRDLKAAGLGGRELVQRTTQSNKNFEQRTVYSQDKFISRKEAKHMKLFTALHPDPFTLCAYHFERAPEKIRYLRPDALAHCLAYGSIRPGGRYIVVDGIGGLLAGAVLERLGGQGRVLVINDADSPPAFDIFHTISSLPRSWIDNTLRIIHWAATEKDWQPTNPPAAARDPGKNTNIDRDRARSRKRRHVLEALQSTRAELFSGFWDGFLMVSNFETLSVLERIEGYLAGTAKIVVHSPYQQPLLEAQAELRRKEGWLHIEVIEPWARRYQVLPGRTHPEMNTSASAGYILSAIKVFDAETAEALAVAHRNELAEAAAKSATEANAPTSEDARVRKDAALDGSEPEPDSKRARVQQ
ncbi:tRNA (adenine(58)-N(1))-methyltransferase non-catalytic subunit trm6 [Tilletia horrida]|nr:tRNA (adenine(58)-N(1))-methyltransferase non-catalytic subunit trm6 [Tilletia horrida]